MRMEEIAASEAPHTPKRHQLTCDQHLQASTLHSIGWTYAVIAVFLDCTEQQIQIAVTMQNTPKKSLGRPSSVPSSVLEEIIQFVTASKQGRRTP